MLKQVIRAENIASFNFPFKTTIYQQENSGVYFNIAVLNNSSFSEGSTAESSYSIWDSIEWDEQYAAHQLYWRKVNTGKDYIMLMGGDICGNR